MIPDTKIVMWMHRKRTSTTSHGTKSLDPALLLNATRKRSIEQAIKAEQMKAVAMQTNA